LRQLCAACLARSSVICLQSLVDAQQVGDEVTLFLSGAVSTDDVVAVGGEFLFYLVDVGKALRIDGRGQRTDRLAGNDVLASVCRVGCVAGGASHLLAFDGNLALVECFTVAGGKSGGIRVDVLGNRLVLGCQLLSRADVGMCGGTGKGD